EPIAAMRPSRMMIAVLSSGLAPVPSITRAPRRTRVWAEAGAGIADAANINTVADSQRESGCDRIGRASAILKQTTTTQTTEFSNYSAIDVKYYVRGRALDAIQKVWMSPCRRKCRQLNVFKISR